MSEAAGKILAKALALPPIERAELIEQLLAGLEFPSRDSVDQAWAEEVEARIDAFERGQLDAIPAREVFDKLNRG